MSTFILSPKDTVIISDSITVTVNKTVETSQPTAVEAETNSKDVVIAVVICTAIVIVSLASLVAFYLWKKLEFSASENEKKLKRNWDVEDCNRRMLVDLSDKIATNFSNKREVPIKTWEDYLDELKEYIEKQKKES